MRIAPLLIVLLVWPGSVALGQSGPTTDPPQGEVVLLGELMGQPVNARLSASKVTDAILDLQTGDVAFLVVGNAGNNSEGTSAFLPYARSGRALTLEEMTRGPLPERFTRAFASQLYGERSEDIYWSRFVEKLGPLERKEFDRAEFELAPFEELKGIGVLDREEGQVGKIADFAADRATGEIAYCVLVSERAGRVEHRAVPLGAFVETSALPQWKIELSREQILSFDPFELTAPPRAVDRGWQEFVSVRYGNPGVKSEEAQPRE